ncbi:MAG: hypothetical protein ACRENW_03000 [Thermodesulfobacteriota bacterium]
MEIDQKVRKQPKYWAISTAAILVTAFVLVQPAMQTAYAQVAPESINQWDDCELFISSTLPAIFGDLIEQNTIKKGEIVKTIHAEKEIFICFLNQGNLPVVVEVTTYVEVFENVTAREVIASNAFVVSCVKDSLGPNFLGSAQVLGCVHYTPSKSPAFVGANCFGINTVGIPTSPMQMDTVRVGKIVKTIETQKQVYICELPDDTLKKVDIVVFTEIYENIDTQEILEVQNHQMRCVIVINDSTGADELRDGTVESCIFSEIITINED